MVVSCEVYEEGGDTQRDSWVRPHRMAHIWCAGWCASTPDRGRLRQVDRMYPTQSIGDLIPIVRMKVGIIPVLFLSLLGHGWKV